MIYQGVELKVEKKYAIDGVRWWCIIRKDSDKVVSKYKLKRDAEYAIGNFNGLI